MKANSLDSAKIYFVNLQSVLYRIDLRNIIFVKAANNYCDIHLADKTITVSCNLLSLSAQLEGEDSLVRVNRSYMINIRHISRILGNMVYMSNKERITLNPSAIRTIVDRVVILK